ncbi:MAG: hypothetical protein HW391_346 [Chloroflexi bacterium]|nr:hypothetical protein [Chloroflexota bacterium]
MDRSNWWQALDPEAAAALAEIWIPVGAPGFSGADKARRLALLDDRFGTDGWRMGHVVRGSIVPVATAILEYEAAYRAFLRANREIVRFLASACGNVYDDNPTNVFDSDYDQPHTAMNHYQDISVRRVMAELVDDPAWPEVTSTGTEPADLVDPGTGDGHRIPRARGFGGRFLLQIRDAESPGYFLNPALVPMHDPALLASLPGRTEWYQGEGVAHLSVEAFWQASKVVEVRYDRFLALGAGRAVPLAGI